MSNLGEQLRHLSSNKDPFDIDIDIINPTNSSRIVQMYDTERPQPQKKKSKEDKMSKLEREIKAITKKVGIKDAEEFDYFFDGLAEDDEDIDFKNSLISLGRKYSIHDMMKGSDAAEAAKAFARTEKKLNSIVEELDTDRKNIESDISTMRNLKGQYRNYRTLAELTQAKATYYNLIISAIRESNSTMKAQFDIVQKNKRLAIESGQDSGATSTSSAIHKLFTMGRGDLVNSVGGYAAISGIQPDEDDVDYGAYTNDDTSDDEIERRYFSNSNIEEDTTELDDGEMFVKHEKDGTHYVLIWDESSDDYTITARNREGEEVTDFPMPSNPSELLFSINKKTGTAVDNLHRRYSLEVINPLPSDFD